MQIINTEILIVGGGPAGATLAKYLSKSGTENILVQRNFNFKKPCGGGIRVDAFDKFEIDKSLIKTEAKSFSLVYKNRRIDINIADKPIGIVDRVAFDRALREEASRCGTDLKEATFVSLKLYEDYIISTIKEDGEYIQIKSSYLVAADGVNSKIRKLINKDDVPSSLTHYCDITSQSYKGCEFHFAKEIAGSHYAWAFPHAEGSNIGTIVDKEALNNFKSTIKLEENTKDLGYKIPIYKNPLFYRDRVFFVGDSASQVLPFTYEGIYYALSSAEILSKVIIEKVHPLEYEKRWNEKFKKRFTTLLKLQKIFLYNNFTISIMMRLFHSQRMQKKLVDLWLEEREVKVDMAFFIRTLKRLF